MEATKLKMITEELSRYAGMVTEESVREMAEAVKSAKRIFLAGAGRSGLAARGFTNRLLHMGFDVHFVGEISCPPIGEGDLIILAKIATVTMFPTHMIGEMSDVIVTVPGSTPKKAEGEKNLAESVQPMGNLFEQMSWLVYDSIIMALMEDLGQTAEEMMARHTNLE